MGSRSEQKSAAERLSGMSLDHRLVLARYFVDMAKSQPEQEMALSVAISALAKDAAVADAMAEGLRDLDPQRLRGPLVQVLAPDKDVQPVLVAVIREWTESGRLNPRVKSLAEGRLKS